MFFSVAPTARRPRTGEPLSAVRFTVPTLAAAGATSRVSRCTPVVVGGRSGTGVCGRRTFVEQLEGLTRCHGQRTERPRTIQAATGLALAGRAGARLAHVLGTPVGRSTVLRLVSALPEPPRSAPRAVCIDEYATRKGHAYGTVIIVLETHRPVDLLPNREASTVATWRAAHPGIEVVAAPDSTCSASASSSAHDLGRRVPWGGSLRP